MGSSNSSMRKKELLAVRSLQELQQYGFCIVPNVADKELLDKTRKAVECAIAEQTKEEGIRNRSPGTLISSSRYPELADLVGNPKVTEIIELMNLYDTKFWKAVIISKPPGGPRLYWHQDCLMWDDPRAYSKWAPMIFLMYYLEDTSLFNGCLRVLPGSHLKRHILHDMGVAHTSEINRMDNREDPRFKNYPGEVDVPVVAGDLVIGDGRMFHASHANRSDERRTVITIWFHPRYSELLEKTQSWICSDFQRLHRNWSTEDLAKISTLIPRYTGVVDPMELDRTPGPRLA